MPSFVLQQVSSPFARSNAAGTLEKPVAIKFLAKYLAAATLTSLNEAAPDGLIRVWGAKAERDHQFIKMTPRSSYVLFRRGKTVFAHAVIVETVVNEALALSLWGCDSDGEAWPLIFFLRGFTTINKEAARFNAILGRKPNDNWQGMTAHYIKDSPKLQEYLSKRLSGEA